MIILHAIINGNNINHASKIQNWMKMALISLEGQYLSMRFLKTQLLRSKIKTDGGSSKLHSKTKIKRKYWSLITSLVVSKTTSWSRRKWLKTASYEHCPENRPLHEQLLFCHDLRSLKHPNCDASSYSTLRNVLGVHRIWNLEMSFRNERDNEETWMLVHDDSFHQIKPPLSSIMAPNIIMC